MAEPALLDHFDLRHYPPHLFDPDLHLADHDELPLGDFAAGDDLDFDLPADFSVDDFLLRSPDRTDSAAGSGPTPSPTASGTGSAVADAPSCEVKHEDSDEGSRGAAASAPNWTLKRKQPSPAASSDAATKSRRSGDGEVSPSASASRAPAADSPSASASRAPAADSDDGATGAVGDGQDDTRRAARLIRNRESAQLSRQRKKRYVEELEEKVKSMNSVINDLNSRISFVVAENATLRQHLGNGNGGPPPPGAYPPGPGALPGMHFPWVPGYALRPHGSHVPLVPIPRLKPSQQQPVSAAAKVTKKSSDNRKASDSSKSKSKAKTKKVASVSIIGLMFVMLILGAFVPGFNHSFGMRGRSHGAMLRSFDQPHAHDRVVSVSNNNHGKVPAKGGLNGSGDSGAVMGTEDSAERKHGPALNSSETLPALLYVPRNGKHVKINGNLIIHSVLASEKAVAHETSSKQSGDQLGVDHKETSIAIARHLSLPGNDLNPQEKSPVDGPLPQWFREGMAGPILNSGMCSEVFQFDISTASTNSAGIIPASPSVNSSSVNATRPTPAPVYHGKLKNRRIMYNEAIPLTGKTVNNTEPFNRTSESSKLPDKKPASSVVVSVLADPREAGDGDSDPRMSPKSLSRIFVVVLLDGVRYVTYSCTLPFKSSSPHLVN